MSIIVVGYDETDASDRALSRNSVGKVASADDPNRGRHRRKQLHHVFEQRRFAPFQRGFVLSHPAALAPRQDEPVR